jgi:hypothetical protein
MNDSAARPVRRTFEVSVTALKNASIPKYLLVPMRPSPLSESGQLAVALTAINSTAHGSHALFCPAMFHVCLQKPR